VRGEVGDTTASTGGFAPACSLTHACSCGCWVGQEFLPKRQGLGSLGACMCKTPTTWPWRRHNTGGVHQAREQRRENSEERWLDNKHHDEDEGTLRFGLGMRTRSVPVVGG
jgi:hypothetical protein